MAAAANLDEIQKSKWTDGSTYWGVGPKMLSPDGKLINYPIF